MCSWTGTLSTTLHVSPASAIIACRFRISSTVQISPLGIWCRAWTMSVAPACRISHKLTGSFGPYQRHDCLHRYIMAYYLNRIGIKSAVNYRQCARYELRRIAGEPLQRPEQLFRFAEPLERRVRQDGFRAGRQAAVRIREQRAVLLRFLRTP